MKLSTTCPNCNGTSLYTRRISSTGSHGPYLLEGLGSFLHYAKFDVVVCADCGLTRFFAEPDAYRKAPNSPQWRRCGLGE